MRSGQLTHGRTHDNTQELLHVRGQRRAPADHGLELAAKALLDLGEDEAVKEGRGLPCAPQEET